MARDVSEADWIAFRAVREIALQRFCQRVLEEVDRLCQDKSRSHHERYISVYRWLTERDGEMGRAFNDPRRSTMLLQLATIVAQGLVEPDELARFTPATRETVELLCGSRKK